MNLKNLTKKQKKRLLILVFGIFVIILIPSLMYFNAPVITETWLTIEVGDFQDTIDDGSQQIQVDVGGYDFLNWDNRGIYQQTNDSIVYYGEATFGWEINIYTDILTDEYFNNFNPNTEHAEAFVEVSVDATHVSEGGATCDDFESSTRYYARWRECTWSTHNKHLYDGNLPITMTITPSSLGIAGQTLNGIEIESTDIIYKFTENTRTEIDSGICGDYNDIYTNRSDIPIGVDEMERTLDDGIDNHAAGIVSQFQLGAESLGYLFPDPTIEVTIYQAGTIDEHFSESGPQTLNLYHRLQPGASKHVEQWSVRSNRIWVRKHPACGWYTCGCFHENGVDHYSNPASRTVNRVSSVKVDNVYIHEEYETKVMLYATVNFGAKLSESQLDDPFFIRGDYVWDESLRGTSNVAIAYDEAYTYADFWADVGDALFGGFNWIISVIIIIGIIVAVIKIAPIVKLLIPKRRRD